MATNHNNYIINGNKQYYKSNKMITTNRKYIIHDNKQVLKI